MRYIFITLKFIFITLRKQAKKTAFPTKEHRQTAMQQRLL
jgi:hypothetical protein